MATDPLLDKLIPLDALLQRLAAHRDQGETIAFTNGCFDVIHAGHVRYLRRAAELADVLVLGINDDASVSRLKGADRPVYPLSERAEILAAFAFVSFIVPFETDSVEPLVKQVRPDILIKGGDYRPDEVVGHEFVHSYGGRVVVLDHLPGRSTTDTMRRMRDQG